ncbi:TIGR03905 family TSCPD domain-containing protein [bacterium]|nr:TIGR03905 family TSCPD domain-containing protein [bacterium]
MTISIQPEVIQYNAVGVCAQGIAIQIFDGIVQDVQFYGGCNGNQKGITALAKGMSIDEVISKLSGIKCGNKDTSCPDQLAKALILYKNKRLEFKQTPSEQTETAEEA